MKLETGKLPSEVLQSLLRALPKVDIDRRLLVGPKLGEDAAHILFGETTLLAKTDPITFATDNIGWYVLNVNANDIAVAGGVPKWFLATLLLPPGSTESDVSQIFTQLGEAATELGVQLAGGHTEVTTAVTQPVICGFMLGEAPASGSVSSSGATSGDKLLLTKGVAIEGTAILANDCRSILLNAGVAESVVDAGARMLTDPGISVLKDARAVLLSGGVTAMHDPTEGGLATALQEMAYASQVDITIDEQAVKVFPECETITSALDIDAWGLISSGAMLAAVRPESERHALHCLADAGVEAEVIGTAEAISDAARGPTVWVKKSATGRKPIRQFARDELARFFDELG